MSSLLDVLNLPLVQIAIATLPFVSLGTETIARIAGESRRELPLNYYEGLGRSLAVANRSLGASPLMIAIGYSNPKSVVN
jgi:hypothetical protein